MPAESSNSLVSAIASKIPGYSGYAEAEKRRAQDREVRKLLAQRLSESRSELHQRMKLLKSQNAFDLMQIADRLHGELDLAEQKTLAAYEGYSSWFSKNTIDAEKLKQIVELDESLISLTDRIRTSIPEAISDLTSVQELGEFIELYMQRFDKRHQIFHS